jgi:hypothetical protein
MYYPDPPNTSSNNMAEPEPGHSSAENSEWKSLSQLDKREWNYKKYKAAEEKGAAEETAAEEEDGADSPDPLPNPGGGGSSATTDAAGSPVASKSPATLSYASTTEIWHPEDVNPGGGVRFVPSASDASRPGSLGPQPYLRFDDPFIMGNVMS